MLSIATRALALAALLGALGCTENRGPGPQGQAGGAPAASSSAGPRGRWTYASEAEAVRFGRIEAAADKLDPCRAGYFMRCSDNIQWFNCSCDDPKGGTDPSRPYWTQIAEPGRLVGKLWQHRFSPDPVPAIAPERQANWDRVRPDALKRAGNGYVVSNLRITQREGKEDWEISLNQGAHSYIANYDGQGAFVRERRETFHPD